MTEASDHRHRPRRRGERLVSAVMDAVLAELSEHGYARFTVDAVAQRAAVGKASLYRRWPGKRDLVLAAVESAFPGPADVSDGDSLRADLLAYFDEVADQLRGPAGPALRGILGDVLGDPTSAAELYSATHRGRSATQLRQILQQAVGRGELTAEAAAAVTARQLEAGPALLRHHYLWEGRLGPDLCVDIVDDVVLPLFASRHGWSPAP